MKNIALAILICLAFSMTAFAGGQDETGPVEIALWSMATGPKKDLQVRMAEEFMEQNPNVSVSLEWIAHQDWVKKLPTSIAAGSAPDIWAQSYRLVHTYKNNLDPLTLDDVEAMGYSSIKEYEDTWEPGALEQYSIGDTHYALMWEYNLFGWGINANHFEAAGLDPYNDAPKYWDDVIEIGKKLVIKEGGRIKREAVTFPYSYPAIWYFMEVQPIIRQLGGTVMNEDGTECLINSKEAVQAVKEVIRRFDEGITDYGLSSTLNYMEASQNEENSMFIVNVVEWPTRYGKVNPNLVGKVIPQANPTYPGKRAPAGLSSWGYGINNQSKHKGWSWKLVDYIVGDPSRTLIESGGLIPRKGWDKTEGANIIPDPELVARMQKDIFPSGLLKNWAEVSEPIKIALQAIIFEGKDIQTELDKAKATVDEAIK